VDADVDRRHERDVRGNAVEHEVAARAAEPVDLGRDGRFDQDRDAEPHAGHAADGNGRRLPFKVIGTIFAVPTQPGRRTVVGSSAFLLTARLMTSAISFVGTALVARTLTTSAWGTYTFVISFTTVVDSLFDFQVSRRVIRELHDKDV